VSEQAKFDTKPPYSTLAGQRGTFKINMRRLNQETGEYEDDPDAGWHHDPKGICVTVFPMDAGCENQIGDADLLSYRFSPQKICNSVLDMLGIKRPSILRALLEGIKKDGYNVREYLCGFCTNFCRCDECEIQEWIDEQEEAE